MSSRRNYRLKFKHFTDFDSREMSTQEFIEFIKLNKHLIKESHFIPPVIGSKGFGKFVVELCNAKVQITATIISE